MARLGGFGVVGSRATQASSATSHCAPVVASLLWLLFFAAEASIAIQGHENDGRASARGRWARQDLAPRGCEHTQIRTERERDDDELADGRDLQSALSLEIPRRLVGGETPALVALGGASCSAADSDVVGIQTPTAMCSFAIQAPSLRVAHLVYGTLSPRPFLLEAARLLATAASYLLDL